MAYHSELTDTHRPLWHTLTMCPLECDPGTSSSSPPFGPKAFAARQSHVTEPQPNAQNHMSKSKLTQACPVIFNNDFSVATRATRWHLRTLLYLGGKRKPRWMRVQQELTRPEPFLPGQGRGRYPRPGSSPECPGTAASRRARHGRGGTPPPPEKSRSPAGSSAT